jgi:hypothetical protein
MVEMVFSSVILLVNTQSIENYYKTLSNQQPGDFLFILWFGDVQHRQTIK